MPTRPILHRRARRTDFAAVNALLSACGTAIPETDRAGLRRFRRLVADLGGDLYVAALDAGVVGVVHVAYTRHLLAGQQAWLALLAVAPDARRQGIGRSLAALAAARARRRGCASLRCAPAAAGADAAAFLAALGWRAAQQQFEFDLPEAAQ
jgi:N-acetylglutamate synthase-like GNAT family acetyltransferase